MPDTPKAPSPPVLEATASTTTDWPYADVLKGVKPLVALGPRAGGSAWAVEITDALLLEAETTFPVTLAAPVLLANLDAASAMEQCGLASTRDQANALLHEVFSQDAALTVEIDIDPDSGAQNVIFMLTIPATKRALRHEFLGRYAREILIPSGASIPALLWSYQGAVPA